MKRPSNAAVKSAPARPPANTIHLTATEAQSQFGRMFDQALSGRVVVISKHNAPRAVLISVERYEALLKAGSVALDSLSNEFDALLEGMQATGARGAMQRAFSASPDKLAKAAVSQASKRRSAR